MMKKEVVEGESEQVITEPVVIGGDEYFNQIKESLSNLPQEALNSLTAVLTRSEDYTGNVDVKRSMEELDPVITTLIDLIKKKEDGGNDVLEDPYGNWLDFIGSKGIIPPSAMPYNRRANFSSVFIRLRDGVYFDEYELDDKGNVVKDDDGNPIITKSTAVNLGVEWRNLNASCNLAYNSEARTQQAKIFGAYGGGVSPIGFDSRFDETLTDLFSTSKKRK